MKIVSLADNAWKYGAYKKNVNSLPSAELAQSVVKVNKSLSDACITNHVSLYQSLF